MHLAPSETQSPYTDKATENDVVSNSSLLEAALARKQAMVTQQAAMLVSTFPRTNITKIKPCAV